MKLQRQGCVAVRSNLSVFIQKTVRLRTLFISAKEST